MPLDHYFSQVHLKNFYSPELGNRLHCIRKSDLKTYTPRAEDVCRIDDGSTNAYLAKERVVEDFLRYFEPHYNAAVAKMGEDKPDQKSIFIVAGFAAYVSSCAPAAMRIDAVPLKSTLETTAFMLDRQGLFPAPPTVFGGRSVSELLQDGAIHFTVDEKYPQALGISTMFSRLSLFGNSPWEILHNNELSSPFFTSDFPVSIEARGNSGIVNHIVPLAPHLAVRIIPDVELSRAQPNLSFPTFRFRSRNLRRAEVLALNRLIVRCAEDCVFYRDAHNWIPSFVAKNRHYGVEAVVTRLPCGTDRGGVIEIASQCVVPRRDAA